MINYRKIRQLVLLVSFLLLLIVGVPVGVNSLVAPAVSATFQRSMAAIKTAVIFDADATVRCVATGTTTVPSTEQSGDRLIISYDADATSSAYIQMTDVDNVKPTSITASTAHWKLEPGGELVFVKETASASNSTWDARHLFIIGAGKVRVKIISTRTNTTPS